jgi:hypothetical protein
MKKAGLMILALVVVVGFAVQTSHAGVICIDIETYCNDLKLFIDPDTGGGIKGVHGYEYGCGYDDRGVVGTLRVTATSKLFMLNKSYWGGTLSGVEFINIDKLTKTGTGTYTYDNGSTGSANYTIVPCPKAGVSLLSEEITEPDAVTP